MQACVIIHNMIIENDRKTRARYVGPYDFQRSLEDVDHQVPTKFANFLVMYAEICYTIIQAQLQHDLVEHL
jgi:hypothetical protein